ncbi:MAG: 30S ribosomal protein S6 [Nitrospinales bacterium]
MRTYQTVLILKPDLDEDQTSQAHEKVAAYISKHGGSVIRTEKWGKKRLAYTVKKNRFGIYLNLFYDCDSLKIKSLENDFRLDETIIKYLILLLGKKEMGRVHGDPDLKEKAEEEVAKTETAKADVVKTKTADEANEQTADKTSD